MISKLKNISIIFLSILILIITYLTFVGFNTDKFNNFFSSKIQNENPEISLKFKKIKFYLEPLKLNFKIQTLSPNLSIKNYNVEIQEIYATISLISFFQNQNSLDKINIRTDDIKITNLIKILRIYRNNFQTIILDKVVKNGEIKLNIDLELDKKGKLRENFNIQGNVKKFEISYLNKVSKISTDFDFVYFNNKTSISNGTIIYEGVKFFTDFIKISKDNNNLFLVEGNLKTNNAEINTKLISEKILGNSQYIESKKINVDSSSEISFNINRKAKITNFSITSTSKIKNIKLLLDQKIIKKIFKSSDKIEFVNQVLEINAKFKNFSRPNDGNISINGSGKFFINSVADDINYTYKKGKNGHNIELLAKLDNNEFYLDQLNFKKKKKQNSLLEIKFKINKDKSILFNKIILKNDNNVFNLSNLNFSSKLKIKSLEKINFNFKNTNGKLNYISVIKNNNSYIISGESFDGSELINNIVNGNKNKNYLSNLNSIIRINLKKFYIDNENYLINVNGNFNITKNKISSLNLKSSFLNGEELILQKKTNDQNEQIINMYTKYPKPLLKRYKFVKGFEGGIFDFQSIKKNDVSHSLLIIDNFKVKEVPVLAKILTLASLQGIADLLTGEGIRFTDFEMSFKSEDNKMIISEIYAIGPAISLMLDGYVEKNKFTSLKGTLVPATTINRTISSIPLLGDILVGKKVGEGVFGVSFKVKGSPKNLKTTVNPIKTLTPRFITRTLEKIKKN